MALFDQSGQLVGVRDLKVVKLLVLCPSEIVVVKTLSFLDVLVEVLLEAVAGALTVNLELKLL